MVRRTTTICCSAAALIASIALAPAKVDRRPISFFPIRTVWSLALNNQLRQPPAYDATRGYFAIDGDRLVAYDVVSGTQQWIVPAAMTSAPAAGGGSIFFVQGDSLTALNGADGSVAWTTTVTDRLAVPPAWQAGWLVLAGSAGSIVAMRSSDGEVIWRHDSASPAHASPTIAADRVYVPQDNDRVVALKVEDGQLVWERRLGGKPNEILAVDDQLLVGAADNFLYCLKVSDGTVDWRWRTGADVRGLPAVDEQRVYFVSLDNVLRALNRSNGVQQWIQMLRLRPTSGPVKAAATIVVGGLQPPLRAFNSKDGASAGEISATGELAAPPHVLTDPESDRPLLLIVTREIGKGATVTLVAQSNEPAAAPFTALPNPITTVPSLPAPPPAPSEQPAIARTASGTRRAR